MYLSLTNIRNILLWGIGIFFLFLAFLYSDNTMVGFSDFKFLSGGDEVNSLNFEITGWDTTWLSVIIYNKEDITMVYKLWFFDAWITNDSFAQKTCLGQNDTTAFWQYVTWDTSAFTINSWGNITKILSVKFPTYYSGTYHWCIMFYPSTIDGETEVNTLPRRWWFVDVLVHPSAVPVIVKAFPSNRVYQTTNNTNTWILKIYDSNKTLIATSPRFTLTNAWTGESLISAPAGTYYMVFKWQSHLASYLSWISISWSWWEFLDFTTGTDLYATQQLNDAQDDWQRYQTAGDLENVLGDYDFTINGNDIAILTANGFQEWWISVLDPRNLNGDTAINASDISVIWVNFAKTDPFFSDNGIFIW